MENHQNQQNINCLWTIKDWPWDGEHHTTALSNNGDVWRGKMNDEYPNMVISVGTWWLLSRGFHFQTSHRVEPIRTQKNRPLPTSAPLFSQSKQDVGWQLAHPISPRILHLWWSVRAIDPRNSYQKSIVQTICFLIFRGFFKCLLETNSSWAGHPFLLAISEEKGWRKGDPGETCWDLIRPYSKDGNKFGCWR